MKKFILSFFFVCCANATTVATMENNVGGLIVLTDVKCKTKTGLAAYATNPNGTTGFGCWFPDDNFVHIQWNDVGVKSYPYSGFTLPEKKSKEMY